MSTATGTTRVRLLLHECCMRCSGPLQGTDAFALAFALYLAARVTTSLCCTRATLVARSKPCRTMMFGTAHQHPHTQLHATAHNCTQTHARFGAVGRVPWYGCAPPSSWGASTQRRPGRRQSSSEQSKTQRADRMRPQIVSSGHAAQMDRKRRWIGVKGSCKRTPFSVALQKVRVLSVG